MHNKSPFVPPKLNTKPWGLAVLEMTLLDACERPAEGGGRNCGVMLAVSAQLALEHKAFEAMVSICGAAVLHDQHEVGINNPKCFDPATVAPLTEKCHIVMKEELDAICPHWVIGDFMKHSEGGKAMPIHWVYKIKCNGARNVQQFNPSLLWRGNHHSGGIDYWAIYAPTALFCQVKLAVTLPANYHLQIYLVGICTDFLGVDWEVEICKRLI